MSKDSIYHIVRCPYPAKGIVCCAKSCGAYHNCMIQFGITNDTLSQFLVIKDIGHNSGGCKTVTNDAERVVAELYANGILKDGVQLLYYDSENYLDELLHKKGKFTGFSSYDLTR